MSGRRTFTGEALEACRQFGGETYSIPTHWYVALNTSMPTDGSPGTECTDANYARIKVRNVPSKWAGVQPRYNTSAIFSRPMAIQQTFVAFSLYTAPTGGECRHWGRFYDLHTGEMLASVVVPARKGLMFRSLKFKYWED